MSLHGLRNVRRDARLADSGLEQDLNISPREASTLLLCSVRSLGPRACTIAEKTIIPNTWACFFAQAYSEKSSSATYPHSKTGQRKPQNQSQIGMAEGGHQWAVEALPRLKRHLGEVCLRTLSQKEREPKKTHTQKKNKQATAITG
jgi:hypothetical protein